MFVGAEGLRLTVDVDGGFAFACLPVGAFLESGLVGERRGAWGGCCESAAGKKGEGED